jgi:hypothetical protein
MDLSGRFNFWRLLLNTRAITPPRVPASLWLRSPTLRRAGWPLLLLVAFLAAGRVMRLSQRDLPPSPLQTVRLDARGVRTPAGRDRWDAKQVSRLLAA